jgi:formylglycine-generating enzyme required for sulfatase activity
MQLHGLRGLFFVSFLAWGTAVWSMGSPDDGMVLIPAGKFLLGSDLTDDNPQTSEFGFNKPLYLDEHPQQQVHLDAYYIDRFEVTNHEYRRFVVERNYWVPDTWQQNGYLLTRELLLIANPDIGTLRELATDVFEVGRDVRSLDRDTLLNLIEERRSALDRKPVTGVAWQDAANYCAWAGKRLPTEMEWEKAARGPDGRDFPWGDEWSIDRLNAGRDDALGVRPVGSIEDGKSYYGLYDMAGNVMEWVDDWYQPYPGSEYESKDFGEKYKVVRGGGWGGLGHYVISHFYRTAYRFYLPPDARYDDLGFRCARDAAAAGPQD